MSFPALALRTGGIMNSQAAGVPTNGQNTIAHNIPNVTDPDWIDVVVANAGTSITDASLVSVDATNIVIDFSQSGVDQATVIATYKHSIVR